MSWKDILKIDMKEYARSNFPFLPDKKKEQGVRLYTKDGKLWEGKTHKMPDGTLMTENPHNENSVKLYRANELIATKTSTGQDEEATKRTEENEAELLARLKAKNEKAKGERK